MAAGDAVPVSSEPVWKLVSKDGQSHHHLPLGMSFIGREECDIILQSSSVDKRHAVIFYDATDKEVRVKDLNSLTGTYVNSIRISGQTYVPLKNLDNIRFGYGPDVFFVTKVPSPTSSPKKECQAPLISCQEKKPEVLFGPASDQSSTVKTEATEVHSDSKSSLHDSLEDMSTSQGSSKPPSYLPSSPIKESSAETELDSLNPTSDPPPPIKEYITDNRMLPCFPQAPPSPPPPPAKPESKTDSSPVSMAFTIAFDTDVAVPKKKLGIKDSISKFAPKKSEPLEKVPPPAPKLKQSKSVESPTPSKKKTSTSRPFSRQAEKEHRRKGSSSGKSTSSTEDCSGCSGSQKRSPRSNASAAAMSSCHSEGSVGSNKEGKLSDSASYLIQRMLNGDPRTTTSNPSGRPPPSGSHSPIKSLEVEKHEKTSKPQPSPDESVPDDRSETGTYTVEADPQVSEARGKIDEVFGVSDHHAIPCKKSSPDADPVISAFKKPPCNNNYIPSPNSDDSPLCDVLSPPAPPRPKRRLPTPPSNQVPLNVNTSSVDSFALPRKFNLDQLKLATTAGSARTHHGTDWSSLVGQHWSPEHYVAKSSTYSSPTETQSEGSPQSRLPWRKTSWNLSASLDAPELDHVSKSETASVGSDRSTNTDSTTSHGSKDPPQMRFNRAFALRRARLGIDSDGAISSAKIASKTKPSNKAVPPPSPNLSRQDGGRFSLRLSKSTPRPVPPKTSTLEPKHLKNQNLQHVIQSGHRRIESDPVKSVPPHPAWHHQSATLSDTDKSRSGAPYRTGGSITDNGSFHRSASFNGTDRLLHTTGLSSPKPCRKSGGECPSRGPSSRGSRELPHGKPPGIPRHRAQPQMDVSPPTSATNTTVIHPTSSPDSQPLDFLKETLATKRELSALDSLVISAIYQLSFKLRSEARTLLEKESQHQPENSDSRLMMEEVLPQIAGDNKSDIPQSDGTNITRDLSTILKNLKRVQQTLEVMSSLMETEIHDSRKPAADSKTGSSRGNNFFVVDV